MFNVVVDDVDHAIGPKHFESLVNLMDPYKGSLIKDGIDKFLGNSDLVSGGDVRKLTSRQLVKHLIGNCL